jgi:RNA polymerase sigma factor (TIGR02999 family)
MKASPARKSANAPEIVFAFGIAPSLRDSAQRFSQPIIEANCACVVAYVALASRSPLVSSNTEGAIETPSTHEITQLLVAWNNGDAVALDQLTPLVHTELHRIARRYMAAERPDHILQTTALVNEAFLRLIDWKNVEWQNRAHFFGLAAQIMRHILVDFARAQAREKRGGGGFKVSLSEAANIDSEQSADLVALDDALQALEKLDPRQARVVELRFFAGLSLEETAEALKVSVGTVRRDWSLAEAWLYRELSEGGRDDS